VGILAYGARADLALVAQLDRAPPS
jgi:hypothetical protein